MTKCIKNIDSFICTVLRTTFSHCQLRLTSHHNVCECITCNILPLKVFFQCIEENEVLSVFISCVSSSYEAKMEIKPGDTHFLLPLSVLEAACELRLYKLEYSDIFLYQTHLDIYSSLLWALKTETIINLLQTLKPQKCHHQSLNYLFQYRCFFSVSMFDMLKKECKHGLLLISVMFCPLRHRFSQ